MSNVSLKALRASLNKNVIERYNWEEKNTNNQESILTQMIKHFSLDRKTLETTFSDSYFKAIREMGLRDFNFINSQLRRTARCNVKSFEKFDNYARSVMGGKLTNFAKGVHKNSACKYCVCIMHNLLTHESKYRSGEYHMTPGRASAMFSIAARTDALASYDFSATLNMHPDTASTQSSSSLRALSYTGVLASRDVAKRDGGGTIVERVNYAHPLIALARTLYDIPAPDAPDA